MERETLEAARGVAFRYLGISARSRAEIERRLEREAFPPDVIAAVVAELEAQNYLNDAQFAQDWIADRADRKKYGKGRLKAELQRRGVEKEFIEKAVGDVEDEAEVQRALAAARPKWHAERLEGADNATLQAEKRKLANFLLRRGFSWAIIKQVFAQLMVNEEELF
ncbi:MAG TPA: regulatory protein RecX [Chthonomonadaceae bacterium]|nr:regulatory protein RecX [Chthonomonadaceae bacterium]